MERVAYIIPVCNIGEAFQQRSRNLSYISNWLLHPGMSQSKDITVEGAIIEQVINHTLPLYAPQFKSNSVIYPYFNKSWLFNVAVKRLNEFDSIILGEMDVLCLQSGLLNMIKRARQQNLMWCHGWNKIIYMNKEASNKFVAGDNVDFSAEKIFKVGQSGYEGGIVWFDRKFFLSIGGMNEWITRMGGEDNEIITRAKYASGTSMAAPCLAYHLWHPTSTMKRVDNIRKRNSEVYKYTQAYPKPVIEFLSGQNFGNSNRPLSETIYLMEKSKGA